MTPPLQKKKKKKKETEKVVVLRLFFSGIFSSPNEDVDLVWDTLLKASAVSQAALQLY